jgi:uncharacterized protein YycO
MIKLQFSTENSTASSLIRTFDHGWCSHVDAVLPDNTLLGSRVDGGVKIREPGYAHFSRTELVQLPTTQDIEDKFYSFLKEQLGKPYDSTAIEAFVFNRDWKKDDSWFCSELQAAALEQSDFLTHKLSTITNRITPSDLLLVCSCFTDVV